MRNDVRRYDEEGLEVLFYRVAHVLACVLGLFSGHFLFDKPIFRNPLIDFLLVPLLYVVLYFANIFVGVGLVYVLEFFKKRNLFGLLQRLNFFSLMFLSYLVLFASFLFLVFWLSGWNSEKLSNLGGYVLIYFILPLGLSLFGMNLIGFEDEQKAMVQGSQSETVSSTNHKEVKADKPIVWNFADYAKRWVVGQDEDVNFWCS
jgi:hypothetical protein